MSVGPIVPHPDTERSCQMLSSLAVNHVVGAPCPLSAKSRHCRNQISGFDSSARRRFIHALQECQAHCVSVTILPMMMPAMASKVPKADIGLLTRTDR